MDTIIVICLLIVIIIGLLILSKICNGKFKLNGGDHTFQNSCIISCINNNVYLLYFEDIYPALVDILRNSGGINYLNNNTRYLLGLCLIYDEVITPPIATIFYTSIYDENNDALLHTILDGYFDANQHQIIYTSQYHRVHAIRFRYSHLRSNGFHKATTVMLDNEYYTYGTNGTLIRRNIAPNIGISATFKETLRASDLQRNYNKILIELFISVQRVNLNGQECLNFMNNYGIHKKIDISRNEDVFINNGVAPTLTYIW
jgi:hypothetical protein